MAVKKKIVPEKYPMPEQDPAVRIRNFNEVPFGYSEELAILEATRCIQCKNQPCIQGCPVGIDIPKFIAQIAAGDFLGAAQTLKEKNALPAVCGRVCPQESQCEAYCTLGVKHQPIAIGRLERFAADYERSTNGLRAPMIPPSTGKRVAVVGSGPAGL